MENIRVFAELVFSTSQGGNRTIRVPDPATSLTQPVINTAVNRILTANPFDETVGTLQELKRSERLVISRIVLLPAA